MKHPEYNPRLLLFIGILCISWSAIFVKLAGVSPFTSAFYRMFLAFLVLLPITIYKRAYRIATPQLLLALLGGAFFSIDLACWHSSLIRSQATVSTLIANCAPIWVGFAGYFILKRKNGWFFWLGTVLAFLGLCVLVGVNLVLHLQIDAGAWLALAASSFYAAYLLTTEKLRKQLSTLTFMFYALVGSVISSGVISLFFEAPFTGFSPISWAYLIGLALVPHLGGWLTINYSLGYIKSNVASVSLLSQSLFTALLAAALLNEQLTWFQIMGGFIVLCGIYVVQLSQRNLQPADENNELH